MSNVVELRPKPSNDIEAFIHCKQCIKEDCDSQQIEVGWTDTGLQIWCRRHDMNIIHIDLE